MIVRRAPVEIRFSFRVSPTDAIERVRGLQPELALIDLENGPGRALVADLERQYGSPLARVARSIDTVFMLRSPWATGLRIIGAVVGEGAAGMPAGATSALSLTGSGLSTAEALAACIGEGIERLSQFERDDDIATVAPADAIVANGASAVSALVAELADRGGGDRTTDLEWVSGHDLRTGASVLVPADWCLRRAAPRQVLPARTAASVGAAAGRSFEDAAVRALLELVERHAAFLWWVAGRQPSLMTLESGAVRAGVDLIKQVRAGVEARSTWLLDLTTELDIPCVAAVSSDDAGKSFCCGLAARLDPAEAACAAIEELCQMEVGLQIAAVRASEPGQDAKLNTADQAHMARATEIDARTCALLHPGGVASSLNDARRDDVRRDDALSHIKARFERAGINAALIDLTRADLSVSVVHAVSADLVPLPNHLPSSLSERAIGRYGGGGRWTHGVSLV